VANLCGDKKGNPNYIVSEIKFLKNKLGYMTVTRSALAIRINLSECDYFADSKEILITR